MTRFACITVFSAGPAGPVPQLPWARCVFRRRNSRAATDSRKGLLCRAARPVLYEYADAALLIVALLLASYLILRRRNRRAIFALMIAALFYFGFWREGCICPIGAIQNVTLTAFDSTYAIPLVAAAFFVIPLVFTLFCGRVFCGAVCPLGAIQDAVLIHPVAVPRWLESGLRLLAYTYLGAAVLFAASAARFSSADTTRSSDSSG